MPEQFVCPGEQRRLTNQSENRSIECDLSDDSRTVGFFSRELTDRIELQQITPNHLPGSDRLFGASGGRVPL